MPELINSYQPEPNALDGKVMLITGAAGGLGNAVAKAAASIGAELILLDHHQQKLNQLHDEIEAQTGRQPGLYPLDMRGANTDDYAELGKTIEDTFKGLHCIVHCAATLGQISPIDHIDAKSWQETFTVNLHAPVLLTKALLPVMRNSGNGNIIFTTDNKQSAYWGAYGISKASIATAMHIFADELATSEANPATTRINCNAIYPGPMRTNLRSSAYPGEDPATIPLADEKVPAYLYLAGGSDHTHNGKHFELA